MADGNDWKARLDRNALWVSLGALALAAAVVAVGVQVAPEVFWDRFVWEDLYGPLAVDAHQCRTSAACPGVEGPPGVPAKDGYTPTSELVYGVVLAVLLYGIFVGLFRRHRLVVDGRFVLALLPWILLGPLARALEDANVFCRPGTDCDPGVFAYVFISPVIYIHIALYVIAFLLLGVFLRDHRGPGWRARAGVVASLLGVGVAAFGLVATGYADGFSALPPVWFVALSALAAAALYARRAQAGKDDVNLVVLVLGVPYALGCIWLIGRWVRDALQAGGVWAPSAWNGEIHTDAALAIAGLALLVTVAVWALSRGLVASGAEAAWARAVSRLPAGIERRLATAALVLLGLAVALSGVVPGLAGLAAAVPEAVAPALGLLGLLVLVVFVFVHVGREAGARPGVLLAFGAGLNLALVFGHMIDGIATWIALNDPFGFGLPTYAEKHPFSDFLLRFWDGLLFPVAKLAMVFVVVWLLDREFRDKPGAPAPDEAALVRRADERNLVGLIKMAIFVLGFAPGLRDLLRVLMGV